VFVCWHAWRASVAGTWLRHCIFTQPQRDKPIKFKLSHFDIQCLAKKKHELGLKESTVLVRIFKLHLASLIHSLKPDG
jgi:hypothetical protein